MIGRLTEIGRCYGLEINMRKNEGNGNLKAPVHIANYDRSKPAG
jgi:hypothetical protein